MPAPLTTSPPCNSPTSACAHSKHQCIHEGGGAGTGSGEIPQGNAGGRDVFLQSVIFFLRTRLGRCYCVAAKSNKLSVYNDSSDSIVSRCKHVENISRPLLVSRLSLTKNWNCNSRHSHRCYFSPPEDKIQVHLDLRYIERLCWKHFMDVEWDLPLEQSKVGGPSDRACQVFTVTAWW